MIVDRIVENSSQLQAEDFNQIMANEPTDQNTKHVVEQLWDMYMNGRENYQGGDGLRPGKSFAWTLVFGSYTQRDWFIVDFLAYCRKHCGEAFYIRLLQESYFSSALRDEDQVRAENDGDQFDAWLRDGVNCKFFITQTGRCGYGPGILQKGDVVVVIFGCRMPMVLRPKNMTGRFQLIGKCFMSELMVDAEINYVANEWRAGVRKAERITLV